MQSKYRLFTAILSLHLLVAQLGVNVYLLHCCCNKKVEYSLIPLSDPCQKNSASLGLCKNSHRTCHSGNSSRPCSNQIVEYKTLDFEAESPFKEKFIILFDVLPIEVYSVKISEKQNFLIPSPDARFPWKINRAEIINKYCSRLC